MKFRLFVNLILLVLLSACNFETKEDAAHTDLTIYTSIYPIQFIVEKIAGDVASVKTIYPAGVDAHTYEPTAKEIINIANSDIFIYLGAHMESFAETAVESLRSQNITFIEIGKHKKLFSKLQDHSHEHSDFDPHIWLDPLRMIEIGSIIKNELTILAPNYERTFKENFQSLKKDLQELDQAFLKTIAPKSKKEVIVTHAAYGYWEERYGIKQVPISGVSADNEPSQRELTKIIQFAKEKNIQHVIFEQNSSDRISTIIQDYLNAEALYIHNLEVLTDQDIENNENYLSLMKKNLHVLDQATHEK